MNSKSTITIKEHPYACPDGSIISGTIVVQNYLTTKDLDRAMQIMEKHGLKFTVNYNPYRSDPDDGDRDSIMITLRHLTPSETLQIEAALLELREVSNLVEAADQILQKETEERLKKIEEQFDADVERFRKIVED
jgi:hypothetical protein